MTDRDYWELETKKNHLGLAKTPASPWLLGLISDSEIVIFTMYYH